MSLRASHDPKFFRRFLYIAIGCFAFTGWCFYDALVKYPDELKRAEVYWTAVEGADGKEQYKAMERTEWREVVREKNWSTSAPHKPGKIKHSIQSQYFYASICIVVGITCLLKWFMARGTWIEGSKSELKTSWGRSFGYDQVLSIDKTKWESKGIAKIRYEKDGRKGVLVFDDFKYDRAVMSDILSGIEKGLEDDQITGADRETVIQARKKDRELQDSATSVGQESAKKDSSQ